MARILAILAILLGMAIAAPAAGASELNQRHGHPGVSVGGNWHHGGGVGFHHPFGFHPFGFRGPVVVGVPFVPPLAPVAFPVPVSVPVAAPYAVPVPVAVPASALPAAAPCTCSAP